LVKDEIPIQPKKTFTGLYGRDILRRGFACDGKRLIISTPQKTEIRTYVVNIENKSIVDISDKSFPCSTTVLDVNEDYVLASRSSLSQPSQVCNSIYIYTCRLIHCLYYLKLVIAKLPTMGQEANIKWSLIDENQNDSLTEAISFAKVEYMDLEHENNDTTSMYIYSCIYSSLI